MHRSLLAFLLLCGVCGCCATLLFLLGSSVRWLKLYPDNGAKRRSIKIAFLASLFHGTVIVYGLSPPLQEEPSQTILLAPLFLFAMIWPIYALSQRFYHNKADLYHSIVSVVIGCQFAWTAFVALSVYCMSTMHGNNLASTPHYHGPARIVGHTSHDNGESASILVAYGGSWACPNFSDLDCKVEIPLSSCVFYDQTGLWSQANSHQECYWKTWDQRNHWQNQFSCSEGFLGMNDAQGDDLNANEDDQHADDDDASDSSSYFFDDGSYDPFTSPTGGGREWPYLVSIWADCQQCDAKIDKKYNRLVFSATKDILPIFPASAFAATALFMLASHLSSKDKGPSFESMLDETDSEETP